MKCPKCGYLGFEHVDRCRNCGYDFSLSPEMALPELPMRSEREPSPLDDLALVDAASPPPPAGPPFASEFSQDSERVTAGAQGHAAPDAPGELPLFGGPITDDVPLITRVSPPRPPLAVRRATPEVPRLRSDKRSAMLDLDPSEPVSESIRADPTSEVPDRSELPAYGGTAGIGARLVAVLIDIVILAAIDAVVVYFTMQICGLAVAEIGILPKGPLIAFLLVQNGGYLVSFTAGGQTLGKMAAGVRVVPAAPDRSLDFGHALLREVLWVVLAVPAGLGFLTALFSSDRRGLHDRFAGTRVVRASA